MSATLNTAAYGGSFGQALEMSAVSNVAAVGAGAIGQFNLDHGLTKDGLPGQLAYVGMHSALGCAASAAEGTGCAGGAIGGAISAATANEIATAVTGGQGNPSSAQLAMITTATTLLGGGIAAALGQDVAGAMNAAENETLNNTCGSENPNGCGAKLAAAGAIAGGAVGVAGSLGLDAATGGLNVVATPAEVAGTSALGGAIGGAFGSALDWWSAHGGASFNSSDSEAGSTAADGSNGAQGGTSVPPVPDGLVGDQSDPRAGPNKGGKRHTSGPLTPENGGTGDYERDLETLTGGTRPWQPGDKAPPGSQVGQNGIFGRPQNSSGGKSIDIPPNGNKPHETLHY
ncbi:DUF637 domain-containing protein [Trinickia fusca]|uniref:DUF637 domain-containing protein n=1 Tax=Trinickia fusca TaxID=2419777 RepID=UPI003CCC7C7A